MWTITEEIEETKFQHLHYNTYITTLYILIFPRRKVSWSIQGKSHFVSKITHWLLDLKLEPEMQSNCSIWRPGHGRRDRRTRLNRRSTQRPLFI